MDLSLNRKERCEQFLAFHMRGSGWGCVVIAALGDLWDKAQASPALLAPATLVAVAVVPALSDSPLR